MKTLNCSLATLLFVLATIIPQGGLSAQEESPSLQPPSVIGSLSPRVPRTLAHLPITNPSATFRVRIGPSGELLDFVCLKASHYEMIPAATRALQNARFEPARESGVATTSEIEIEFNFMPEKVVGQSIADHAESQHYQPSRYIFKRSKASELEEPLKIVSQGPSIAPGTEDDSVEGKAVVEFYVDLNGVPRLLRVVESDQPIIGEAAIQTFKNLRFSAPTANRRPTVVKVRLPYQYP